MATNSSAEIKREIEVVSARMQLESKHLRSSIDAIRPLLRDTFGSRSGLARAFVFAALVGVLGGLRTRLNVHRPRLK